MKVKVKKSKIYKALGLTHSVSEIRSTMPILSYIYLEGKKDRLEMKCTDLKVSFISHIPAKVKQEGSVVIPSRDFYNLIKEFPEGEILLEKENKGIKIKQGRSLFHLLGRDVELFPIFPEYNSSYFFPFKQETFLDMIQKTIYSVSTDKTRNHLNGVFFQVDQEESLCNMVSTDSHRLSFISKKLEMKKESKVFHKGVIIPRKGVNEIRKTLIEFPEGDFEILSEGPQLILRKKEEDIVCILMMRLIEGNFPDYKKMIPKKVNEPATIDKNLFQATLKRVSLLSNEKSRGIFLNLKKGVMELSSENKAGSAKEKINVDYEGENVKVGFNSSYISDVLLSFEDKEEEISFEIKDNESPGIIQSKKNSNYKCIVMPMRI